MKILSPWPWPQGHPLGGDGADKNFRPISTIMPNMNEIHQRFFKIWGLINFNAKTLTLWRKDERMNVRTNVRTYEEQTDEWKSENYIPPHTSYVGGIISIFDTVIVPFLWYYNGKHDLYTPNFSRWFSCTFIVHFLLQRTVCIFWSIATTHRLWHTHFVAVCLSHVGLL